jgi:hypothetical protein
MPEPSEPPKEEEPTAAVDKEAAAEAIVEQFGDAPVPVSALAAAGLTYADLPPKTPVEVRTDEEGNPIVITAEVAAALVVLQDPAALVSALFTDPAQAVLAVLSIGADMSPAEREESQKVVVASVVVGSIAQTAAAAGAVAAMRRNP